MALNTYLSNVAVNTQLDALAALCDGGTIKIYSGSQPANADTAPSGTLLATLTFSSPAFGASVAGVITANAISPELLSPSAGTATWFRVYTVGGSSLWDGSIGQSGCNLNLSVVAIPSGARVEINSFVHTLPKQGS